MSFVPRNPSSKRKLEAQPPPNFCTTTPRHRLAPCGAPDVRDHYLDGSWVHLVSPETLAQWRLHWPGHRHPYDLSPSEKPRRDNLRLEKDKKREGISRQA